MQTSLAAVTAFAGSLLLAPLMLGPVQAGSAPDLKNAISATHAGTVILVRRGGGDGGGHGGAMMGGGRMGGGGGRHAFASRGFDRGPRFAEREGRERHRFVEHEGRERFDRDDFRHRHVFDRDDFRHRRFFVSNVFIGDYPYYYGGCYWLRRQAIITGSPYWWGRYEACRGYY
jgi:hypothetical protein